MNSLVIVLFAVFTLFSGYHTFDHDIPKCCSCDKFSTKQGEQLRALLQEEAKMLRKGMQMMCPKKEDKWYKVRNMTNPQKLVCFSARGDNPGVFRIDREGFVAAIKLVHVSGHVSCGNTNGHSSSISYKSNWGCPINHPYIGSSPLGTFITTPSRQVLFPRKKIIGDKSKTTWYSLPGFDHDSPILVFHDFSNPEFVQQGQELQLWYGEDLENIGEDDNSGESTCVEVYVWYL